MSNLLDTLIRQRKMTLKQSINNEHPAKTKTQKTETQDK
jgi:hypothetical protein